MPDYSEPQTTSHDEPLFVLKYRRGHVVFRIFCLSLIVLVFSVILLGIAFAGKDGFVFRLACELLFVLLLIYFILKLVGLALFKEIRLYEDRMVKVSKLTGDTEIRLAEARFQNASSAALRAKRLASRDTKWFLSPFKGIFYYEDLPDPKDAKKLNYLLAALSGKKIREFEEATTIDALIKEGCAPQIVDRYTLDKLDSEILRDYIEEKKFNRAANKGLVVAVLLLLVAMLILVFFIVSGKP